ncbi:MAG: AAA family ATPase [Acidimicrobiia bacterium]|nr:AAA family ATPase [Acidimicrobiia bacterium]
MRFVVRTGTDPTATADATMLAAMGMPGGGTISIGRSYVLVRPGEVPTASVILLGPLTQANADVADGQSVEAKRIILPHAERVVAEGAALPGDHHGILQALQGLPVRAGEVHRIAPAYLTDGSQPADITISAVEPKGAATVGMSTTLVTGAERGAPNGPDASRTTPAGPGDRPLRPTRSEALLAGLDAELDLLTGWLALLTSLRNLPAAWGLPQVAGIVLEGPTGCGKSELVESAARAAGAKVHSVNLDLVFKPERLLDLLEKAVKTTSPPTVVFVNRLEAVAGEEGITPFRTQVAAILRWFLDAVAERPGVACVLGVASAGRVDSTIIGSPLLPRTLTVPPPDLRRRTLLYEAALAKVPTGEVAYDILAARSAGFSGSDILAAVVHASTSVARSGEPLSMEQLVRAVEDTTPSLGSAAMGDIPSYGFDKVAGLEDVKQRLTEAVIWPMTQRERFAQLGIEPPRGILLYGPPGTGKTFVVRALAHEAGAAFFPVKGAELLDKFVGESERGVREVFARARAAAPSILFFDEFDALAPVRGSSTTSVTDSVVAALLTELDGVGERGDVVVIAATNRQDLIDPALLRSGRFEVHIELGLPEEAARRALLDIVDVPFADDVDLDELARLTEGLSFADLTGLLREAALAVLRSDEKALTVGWTQIEGALKRFGDRTP